MKVFMLLLLMPLLALGQNIKVSDKLTQAQPIVSDNLDDLKEYAWYKFEDESMSAYVYIARQSEGLPKVMEELEALLKLNKMSYKSPESDESIGKFNPKRLDEAAREMNAGGLYVKKYWLVTPGNTEDDSIMIEFKSDLLVIEVIDVK